MSATGQRLGKVRSFIPLPEAVTVGRERALMGFSGVVGVGFAETATAATRATAAADFMLTVD